MSKVLGFVQGLLCGAKKFTHVAYLRRDPLVPEMLGIRRVASQSVLSRFFQGFSSAGRNLGCFRRLFGWGLERLPSRPGGYALDLDSTRLFCTKTAIRRAWPSVTPGRDSSRDCIRCWR